MIPKPERLLMPAGGKSDTPHGLWRHQMLAEWCPLTLLQQQLPVAVALWPPRCQKARRLPPNARAPQVCGVLQPRHAWLACACWRRGWLVHRRWQQQQQQQLFAHRGMLAHHQRRQQMPADQALAPPALQCAADPLVPACCRAAVLPLLQAPLPPHRQQKRAVVYPGPHQPAGRLGDQLLALTPCCVAPLETADPLAPGSRSPFRRRQCRHHCQLSRSAHRLLPGDLPPRRYEPAQMVHVAPLVQLSAALRLQCR